EQNIAFHHLGDIEHLLSKRGSGRRVMRRQADRSEDHDVEPDCGRIDVPAAMREDALILQALYPPPAWRSAHAKLVRKLADRQITVPLQAGENLTIDSV